MRLIKRILAFAVVIATGVSFLLYNATLSSDVPPEHKEGWKYIGDNWYELQSADTRRVKSMSVASQPEIVFCKELNLDPDVSSVIFRLEYEDGSVKNMPFLARFNVKELYDGVRYNGYGMVLMPYNYDTTGKIELEVVFDNAEMIWSWEDMLPYPDGEDAVKTTVKAYNLSAEEYLRRLPSIPELRAGQPMKMDLREIFMDAFTFAPEEDGVYLLSILGSAPGASGRLEYALDKKGKTIYGFEYYSSDLTNGDYYFALRLNAGERYTYFCRLKPYDVYPMEHYDVNLAEEAGKEDGYRPMKISMTKLETRVLRKGEDVAIENRNAHLIQPELPKDDEIYKYQITNALLLMAFHFGSSTAEQGYADHSTYRLGAYIDDANRWNLTPYYTVLPNLLPSMSGKNYKPPEKPYSFILVGMEEYAGISLVPERILSAMKKITLQKGDVVPLSDLINCDAYCALKLEFSGKKNAVTLFEQDGIAMLRANERGTVGLRVRIAPGVSRKYNPTHEIDYDEDSFFDKTVKIKVK